MSAYELVASLAQRQHRIVPQQAYRVLGRLIDDGRVRRVESINAYCLDTTKDSFSPVLVCRQCRQCRTLGDDGMVSALRLLAPERDFDVDRIVVEIVGLCPRCSAAPADGGL